MSNAQAFREAVVAHLRDLLDDHDTNVAAVERQMGKKRGYVGDALRDNKRLMVELVAEVLEHLGVDPAEFFANVARSRWDLGKRRKEATAIAENRPSAELLRRLEQRAAATGDPLLEDVSALLRLLTDRLELTGLVDSDEVEAVLTRQPRKDRDPS